MSKVFTLFRDRVEVVYMKVERYTINMYDKTISIIIRKTEIRGITYKPPLEEKMEYINLINQN